jgi:anti-anti-sigma factor
VITSDLRDDTLTISICETFKFPVQAQFRQAYESQLSDSIKNIIIDFSKTRYMDSSALGMLLILRDFVEEHTSMEPEQIKFIRCSQEVKDILEVTHFERLFTIQ